MYVSADAVRELDELIRNNLLESRAALFSWLLFSTVIVAIGVVLEGPEVLYEAYGIFRRRLLGPPPDSLRHTPSWITLLALFGWILVAIGVAGEGAFEAFVSMADGRLQTFNDILLTDTQRQTAEANERAFADEKEVLRLRKALTLPELSEADLKEIADACRPFAKPGIKVAVVASVSRTGSSIALKIMRALSMAGFNPPVDFRWTGEALYGINVSWSFPDGPVPLPLAEAKYGIIQALSQKLPVVPGPRRFGEPSITVNVGEYVIGSIPR